MSSMRMYRTSRGAAVDALDLRIGVVGRLDEYDVVVTPFEHRLEKLEGLAISFADHHRLSGRYVRRHRWPMTPRTHPGDSGIVPNGSVRMSLESAQFRSRIRPEAATDRGMRQPLQCQRLPPMRIAVIPGDGIGVEVTAEAVKVVPAAGKVFAASLVFESLPWGADSLPRRPA